MREISFAQALEEALAEEMRRDERVFTMATAAPANLAAEAYVERVWADEEWTRGCYGCAMPTGAWTEFGSALRAPIGPLHWAGAETATVWSGYMDGAVSSGERRRGAERAGQCGGKGCPRARA